VLRVSGLTFWIIIAPPIKRRSATTSECAPCPCPCHGKINAVAIPGALRLQGVILFIHSQSHFTFQEVYIRVFRHIYILVFHSYINPAYVRALCS